VGSHVVGVLENPTLLSPFKALLYFMGKINHSRGMLGGLIGVELTQKQIGVTVSSGDLMVYPLILAMLLLPPPVCFLPGWKIGNLWHCFRFYPGQLILVDGIRRHPTNLYEILFWLMFFHIKNFEKHNPLLMVRDLNYHGDLPCCSGFWWNL